MPTPTPKDLDHMVAVAVDDEGNLDDALLGKLVFFQVSDDIRVNADELAALFTTYGLDASYLPKAINPASEFGGILKRAKSVATIDSRRFDLEFRPQVLEGGAIVADLVRVRNLTGDERQARALAHGYSLAGDAWRKRIPEWEMVTVAKTGWDPKSPDVLAEPWIDPEHEAEHPYDELLAEIDAEFEERRQFYTGSVITRIVTKILNDAMGVRARPSGGVWIVPKSAIEITERIKAFVRLLDAEYRHVPDEDEEDKHRPSEFATVHLVDVDDEARVFIKGKVEERVLADLKTSVTALHDLARAGQTPQPAELRRLISDRNAALALRDHYADVVGEELTKVTDMLDLFDRAFRAARTVGSPGQPGATPPPAAAAPDAEPQTDEEP